MSGWWGDAWRSAVENDLFDDLSEFGTGRTLARKQTPELELEPALASCPFLSRAGTVVPSFGLKKFTGGQWASLATFIAARPALVAAVLTGTLSPSLEDAAEPVGARLVPGRGDITFSCTCDAWQEPCRHVVALFLLVGEAVAVDPFLLLLLRGGSRNDLVRAVRSERGGQGLDAGSGPRGTDVGVRAADAFARPTSKLPSPRPLPRRWGTPVELRVAPPVDGGVGSGDLRELAADAARRAARLLVGDDRSGLHHTSDVDVVRRAAEHLDDPDHVGHLASRSGLDVDTLTVRAIAWSRGGMAGLTANDDRWPAEPDRLRSGVEALGAGRCSANAVIAGSTQLRLDRGGLWWRFDADVRYGWVLSSDGFDDPADALADVS